MSVGAESEMSFAVAVVPDQAGERNFAGFLREYSIAASGKGGIKNARLQLHVVEDAQYITR